MLYYNYNISHYYKYNITILKYHLHYSCIYIYIYIILKYNKVRCTRCIPTRRTGV